MRSIAIAAVGGLAVAALMCGRPAERRSSADEPPGEWVVVGHRLPGVSAMSDAEAAAWHGRTIRFGARAALSGDETCAQPVYKEKEILADQYLSSQYHVRASTLGLESSQTVRLTEVYCGDQPWATLGGVLLRVAPDRGFAVWDGVFLELQPAGSGAQ